MARIMCLLLFLSFCSARYMLGLDQKTLRPVTPGLGGDETPLTSGEDSASEREKLDREQLAWTCALALLVSES